MRPFRFFALSVLGLLAPACSNSGGVVDPPPDPTPGMPMTLATVSAGDEHTCGLDPAGAAFCWGNGQRGELGNGRLVNLTLPVRVEGGLVFSSVLAGDDHTCGQGPGAVVHCWGGNSDSQLGDGTTQGRPTPAPLEGAPAFPVLVVGRNHSCAQDAVGLVFCWGRNDEGQLGDGTTADRRRPTAVAGGMAFVSIDAGADHTCALDGVPGAAWCWGDNTDGELGDGTLERRLQPTAVAGGHVFTGISAGWDHTCGIRPDGSLLCWGQNTHGQLADGTMVGKPVPTPAAAGLAFQELDAGRSHTCGVEPMAAATWCWGSGQSGELGNGAAVDQPLPVMVSGGHAFLFVSAGDDHNCGVTAANRAFCWGQNDEGQLGDGTLTNRSVPTPVLEGIVP
jgi:alpha-tubulin suppressor-like RCC1 family protein